MSTSHRFSAVFAKLANFRDGFRLLQQRGSVFFPALGSSALFCGTVCTWGPMGASTAKCRDVVSTDEAKGDAGIECPLTFYAKSLHPAIDLSSSEPQEALMLVHIEAPKSDSQVALRGRRKDSGLILSAAIDVSGSMAGEKLCQAKTALGFVLNELNAQDQFGLVSFHSLVREEAELRPVSRNKSFLSAAIENLSLGGITNLSGGLLRALSQCPAGVGREEFSNGERDAARGRRHITMLFTDGHANCGITDAGRLCHTVNRAIDESPYSDETIYTFGFGADHDEKLLSALAEATQGNYFYIEKAKDMIVAFAECLGGLKGISRRSLKLELEPRLMPGVEISEVLTVFPTHKGSNGKRIVTLKDIYAEEKRDLLVRLRIDPAKVDPADRDRELSSFLRAKLTCVNEVTDRGETYTASVKAKLLSEPPAEPIEKDSEVNACHLQRKSWAALDRLTAAADAGNWAEAKAEYRRYELCALEAGQTPDRRFEQAIDNWRGGGKNRVSSANGALKQQRASNIAAKREMMERAAVYEPAQPTAN